MLINATNAAQGNKAMAWVLLLYYHLIREGGITHDQTVYIDPNEFDAFEYLEVEVAADQRSDFDQTLLRQGAAIFLLCELNDVVTDYEADYLAQPFTHRILTALTAKAVATVPEVSQIIQAVVAKGEAGLDYGTFQSLLQAVFEHYVVKKFKSLSGEA